MIIALPQQASCVDRRQVTRGSDPGRWLVPELPSEWSVHTFHFFVNWTQYPPRLGQDMWLTRLVNFAAGESPQSVTAARLASVFASGGHGSALESVSHLCALYGHLATAVLLPEIPVEHVEDSTPVWMIPYRAGESLAVTAMSLSDLKVIIRREAGGSVRVGSKGLTYGTSAVECALSSSDAAYPGDVDAVIVDSAGVVRCVVEYKKHNLGAPIGDHLINRYYPNPDGRKYRRLEALVSHYRQTTPQIPFVVLYYSTKSPVIRLQEIGELLSDRVVIARDSGDLMIEGMTVAQVAAMNARWLGLTS